jgi:hypothetical protein
MKTDLRTFLVISRTVLLNVKNISVKIVEKIKTHILYSVTFFCFFRKSYLL